MGPVKKAYQALPSDPVRKQHPASPFAHVVLKKELAPDMSSVTITTTQGTWQFGYDEPLLFPRREDGSTVDHTRSHPLWSDLSIGDRVAGMDGTWEYPQTVTSVTVVGGAIARIGLRSAITDTFRYDFDMKKPIKFPRATDPIRNRIAIKRSTVTVHGPYGFRKSNGEWEWLFFAMHPAGRGRWPAFFKPICDRYTGYRFGTNMVVVRPLDVSEWPLFYGKPEDRHPKDPSSYTEKKIPAGEKAPKLKEARAQLAELPG